MVRSFVLSIVVVLAMSAAGTLAAFAQELGRGPSASPAAKSLPDNLDDLFAALKRERNVRQAGRISERIWALWFKSGSKSVDLLTGWARKAMAKKKYAVALDLLDQVTTLRPDYAEGWNQRATLHYVMEDYGKSIADIEKVLALEPRHYGAFSGLGAILQSMDRKQDALNAWYKALEYYPALKSAQNAVIELEGELEARGI